MLWIIKGEQSHAIISCNTHHNKNDETYQIWITRPNGKNLMLDESKDFNRIVEIKEAIDFAVEHKETALRL